jgi:hypothetical protein
VSRAKRRRGDCRAYESVARWEVCREMGADDGFVRDSGDPAKNLPYMCGHVMGVSGDDCLRSPLPGLDSQAEVSAPPNGKRRFLSKRTGLWGTYNDVASPNPSCPAPPLTERHAHCLPQGIPTIVILLTKLYFSRKHADVWKVTFLFPFPLVLLCQRPEECL